jgi:hypothetical protein
MVLALVIEAKPHSMGKLCFFTANLTSSKIKAGFGRQKRGRQLRRPLGVGDKTK